jgi:hypothetical protein
LFPFCVRHVNPFKAFLMPDDPVRSSRQNIDATDARCAVHVGITDLGLARHLPSATFTSQLHTDLVDLSQTRGANGFAIGETAAIGIHRAAAR